MILSISYLAATTGECVYFGCVNDQCRVRDSFLEHNYCHDALGSQGGSRAAFQVKVEFQKREEGILSDDLFMFHSLVHTMLSFETMPVTKSLDHVLLFMMITIAVEILSMVIWQLKLVLMISVFNVHRELQSLTML